VNSEHFLFASGQIGSWNRLHEESSRPLNFGLSVQYCCCCWSDIVALLNLAHPAFLFIFINEYMTARVSTQGINILTVFSVLKDIFILGLALPDLDYVFDQPVVFKHAVSVPKYFISLN
jgi:hypothetical protein